MEEILIQMAKRYRLYQLHFAYIPLQDLAKYEEAYKKIYGK